MEHNINVCVCVCVFRGSWVPFIIISDQSLLLSFGGRHRTQQTKLHILYRELAHVQDYLLVVCVCVCVCLEGQGGIISSPICSVESAAERGNICCPSVTVNKSFHVLHTFK